MPTLLLIYGFRFFFYSNENNEPIHVHVTKSDANAKIWLEPNIKVAYIHGFNKGEETKILEIVQENYEAFKNKWNEYFNK